MNTQDIQDKLHRDLQDLRDEQLAAALYGVAVLASIGAMTLICLAIALLTSCGPSDTDRAQRDAELQRNHLNTLERDAANMRSLHEIYNIEK